MLRIESGNLSTIGLSEFVGHIRFSAILADPLRRFANRTGTMAPESKRLAGFAMMSAKEICALPVGEIAHRNAHLYLWVPNALLAEGLEVMEKWGFMYKTNIIWYKTRKDGGPDRRGVGFYFRNVTEMVLLGVKGQQFRTLGPARSTPNFIATQKRGHSQKPDELYDLIEACSPGPFLELFARQPRPGWWQWGSELTRTPTVEYPHPLDPNEIREELRWSIAHG